MKLRRPKVKITSVSTVLILAAYAALVGFGATFGLRWALLAAAVSLALLGVAVNTEGS